MLRPSILGAALAWAAMQPAYAQEGTSTIDDLSALKSEHGQPESDITLSGNAAFLTQYGGGNRCPSSQMGRAPNSDHPTIPGHEGNSKVDQGASCGKDCCLVDA
jgi:hypothetical protein